MFSFQQAKDKRDCSSSIYYEVRISLFCVLIICRALNFSSASNAKSKEFYRFGRVKVVDVFSIDFKGMHSLSFQKIRINFE